MPLAAGHCLGAAAHQAQIAAGQIVDGEGLWLSGIDRLLLLNLCLSLFFWWLKHLCFFSTTRNGAQVDNQDHSITDFSGIQASYQSMGHVDSQ